MCWITSLVSLQSCLPVLVKSQHLSCYWRSEDAWVLSELENTPKIVMNSSTTKSMCRWTIRSYGSTQRTQQQTTEDRNPEQKVCSLLRPDLPLVSVTGHEQTHWGASLTNHRLLHRSRIKTSRISEKAPLDFVWSPWFAEQGNRVNPGAHSWDKCTLTALSVTRLLIQTWRRRWAPTHHGTLLLLMIVLCAGFTVKCK